MQVAAASSVCAVAALLLLLTNLFKFNSIYLVSVDDSMPTSMASTSCSPRLSTRRFGVRKPAQVWTDAVPRHSPPFGPGAQERKRTGHR
jgi:hypothetical protein